MALDFDTSRAPMRPEEYEGLVRAVLAARSGDESVWVEWKSGMDLGSAEGKVNHPGFHAPSGFCEPAGWLATVRS